MKRLAIIVPPQRLDVAMLMACMGMWRKEYDLRIFSVDTRRVGVMTFDDVKAEDLEELHNECFDAVAVMDGVGTKDYLWDDIKVIAELQRFDKARKLIAGLGLGAIVLAQSGVLVGKQAAVGESAELMVKLASYGAIFVPDDVVMLKWIITGSGKDVEAFAQAVSSWLRNRSGH
ncbi:MULTISPECIES: DJ-1/PfpI family protein [unclassified Pseudomonas]|uniref:DJ-1/PfpI family protein n=1 Tax=unclassified Pseudomonas TaxID=196821 RepID=UPI00087131A0|nr:MULTISPECIES: DJ-1/PfpI family protein [unclassified Pseudomonas]SCW68153.1 Putative intracellular protease/amidase [Pseudomonas sp. NFACC56-3]SFK33369.1 Putative intracellular protease/amidase [Pseudomonas sp. NFACC52]